MNNYELDLQNLNCIKEIRHMGSTTYVDICNTTREVVEWGAFDWVINGVLTVVLVSLIGILIGLGVMAFKDFY